MTTPVYRRAVAVLADATASVVAARNAADRLRGSFEAGDYAEGYLPVDAPEVLVALYLRAGDDGDASALTSLGLIRLGHVAELRDVVPTDEMLGLADLRRAADYGDRLALTTYIREVHRAQSAEAKALQLDAAHRLNGLIETSPDATVLMLAAWMLHAGHGYQRDDRRARAAALAAADMGNADGLFEMYVYHSRGIGGPIDRPAAVAALRDAANAGHVKAMAILGAMYDVGSMVDADAALSVHYYAMAVHAGDRRAATLLSNRYRTGDGVPRDPDRADYYAGKGPIMTRQRDLPVRRTATDP